MPGTTTTTTATEYEPFVGAEPVVGIGLVWWRRWRKQPCMLGCAGALCYVMLPYVSICYVTLMTVILLGSWPIPFIRAEILRLYIYIVVVVAFIVWFQCYCHPFVSRYNCCILVPSTQLISLYTTNIHTWRWHARVLKFVSLTLLVLIFGHIWIERLPRRFGPLFVTIACRTETTTTTTEMIITVVVTRGAISDQKIHTIMWRILMTQTFPPFYRRC